MGSSLNTSLNLAVEDCRSDSNCEGCAAPSIVRDGSYSALMQAGGAGLASCGTTTENWWRTGCGSVGARAGWPLPGGLSHGLVSDGFILGKWATSGLRNDRSSRMKNSRFLPQLNVR